MPSTILLVEDNALLAGRLSEALRSLGVSRILVAMNNDTAAQVLSEERPDGVILDVLLGSESSAPTAERLTEAGIPFIFFSGSPLDPELMRRFPDIARLRKPAELDHLRAVIGLWA
ncbi:response regulator [Rhodobacterales bacterium HKCCE3408]|nr:response regulator [Rhodobacterales bacterium HKCCE3408]